MIQEYLHISVCAEHRENFCSPIPRFSGGCLEKLFGETTFGIAAVGGELAEPKELPFMVRSF